MVCNKNDATIKYEVLFLELCLVSFELMSTVFHAERRELAFWVVIFVSFVIWQCGMF